ncbi:MAG: cytochrome oxidase subunit III [Zunongwangia sp.]|jgi:cytochrome c oxidase subunit 3|uniref:Cytochrome c oxidase subunit III n=2 Tax=Zunongwangia profunda TaxID=398743 RepID=D5BFK9_ZUNPS|nr:cytochrome c oxidase subunit 3 [Zunongwangia profunda]MAC63621.1 cytochrome oxidase subunit III [Flavobacteriaceae bacterium]MAO34399.1 cytochrome oxidase subunit III [Zunongwangia sp.]ADF50953.1 cytochrome c oxidase subunit III [Zunongwangia profunda SM-A87]MAG87772.1 cytochrome oxidase subunit III [Flavobacteriaceae bacterium]MAS72513.1 cytochrome oxidase subunit III [Zunongwangia sp.]|tara:strand:- start:8077 stop:8658 length:582 start_codon:yes stop_codon:yes gene_type:complete
MDLTKGSEQERRNRAKKMMLWFAIISMGMMFAGLTSAYVVSKTRPDWLTEFELPQSFMWSTIVIFCSSITMFFAKKNIISGNRKNGTAFLLGTLILALLFVLFQFQGFAAIVNEGYYFTGSESTITTSFIYVLVLTHLAHLAAGLIVLLVLIYNHFKQRYYKGQTLGLELGATFWHFLDVLWVYLFFFLYFFR